MLATAVARPVEISGEDAQLEGTLELPGSARGIVLFAHGSGSSRLSPPNQAVASVLHHGGLGTLLFDLLTESETRDRANVFDISLLGSRLVQATAWLDQQPEAEGLPLGYFGASTGAAAALVAASRLVGRVGAVVSRGGRPDLAGPWLGSVRAPTLLIVGGEDTAVLGLNRLALERLDCPKRLAIIPGATHLFEEPGTLEQVARLAADWFLRHLAVAEEKAARVTKGGIR
jgi:alpha-beta hydrolase superfamily lysophospholipase